EMGRVAEANCAYCDERGNHPGSGYNRRDRPVRRNPGCGTVAWDRSESGQRARCQRDRAWYYDLRPLPEWRCDSDGESVGNCSWTIDSRACCSAQVTRCLLRTFLRRCRWPDLLWA